MALVMLLLVGGVAMGQSQSKTYYTLTNGRLWWSNGLESDDDQTYRDPVAFDASRSDARGNWLEVHPHGSEHVTHITAKGDTYLKLDLTDRTNPKITTSDAFDLYCAWQRTGSAGATGYYFQEWFDGEDTWCYYLVGTQNTLKVIRAKKGSGLSESSYWYDWDFGAAVWETPTIDGVKKNRYYWIMLSTIDREGHEITTPVWTMSRHSYQRPEDIQFTSYDVAADAPTYSTTAQNSNLANLRYYDDVATPSQINYYGADQTIGHSPAGNGALVLPVTVIPHDEDIREMATIDEPSDPNYGKRYGLQKVVDAHNVTTGAGITIADNDLDYRTDAGTTLTANMIVNNAKKVPMTVVPAYTEYKEETYRRGINLNYHNRTSDVFGSAGVPTTVTHFDVGNSTLSDSRPTEVDQETAVSSILFNVDSRSLRYVSIDTLDWASDPANFGKAELSFNAPCNGYHTVYVYVRVKYQNGAEQRDTATLTLHFDKPSITPQPEKGPVVRGALFGGGRMANVTGGTAVYIHSTDSIPTVYGGNDIAGWVQGDAGANLYIGTEFTSKDHPVHIGSVYGGGNGYYTYQGINDGYDEAMGEYYNPYWKKKSTSLMYSAYYFNGKVYPWSKYPDGYLTALTNAEADRINMNQSEWSSLTPVTNHQFEYTPFYIGHPDQVDQAETGDDGDGTIPYIKTAHITVGVPEGKDNGGNATFFVDAEGDSTHWHNDYILIDTIFGGARNAFIGVESNEENPANGVTIDVNGGTCYAVFGGNNVGGSVANTSTVFVNVHDTKLIPADQEYADTYLNGFGRDFGIRYLFGGGNLVDGSHANVTISGGMIDTAYLGGNKATVKNPIGTVECLMGDDGVNQRTGFGYDGHYIMSNTTYPSFKNMGTGWVAKYESNPSFFDTYGPDNFHPEEGQYNVRCLFGGNNSADMDNLTTIQLHSGGISCVYGGGNEGDMTNDNLFNVTGPVSGTGTVLDGTTLGCGDNMLFPNPLYNYLIADAFDLNADGTPKADGWAHLYGKRTLPSKVGTLVTALENSQITCDYVFGGSRMGNIKNSCGVYLMGGIYGYVNGGNDVSGDIGSTTENEGAYLFLGGNTLVVGDAVSGSDGYYHCEDPDNPGHYDDKQLYDTYASDDAESYDPYNDFEHMLFPTHNRVNFYLKGGLILGQTVAGAVHANVGFEGPKGLIKRLDTDPTSQTYGTRVEQEFTIPGGEKSGTVRFLATGGHVLGNGFGGGFQSDIYGLTYLTIQGNTQYEGSFFAGNDCTGSTTTFSAYYNTNDYDRHKEDGMSDEEALDAAYADMKASDGITPLNTHDGSWNALYSAYLRINDTPRIHCVYGSGNGAYNYYEDRPYFEEITYCEPITGRNLLPQQSSSFIDIHTSGPHHYTENPHSPVGIDTVFGGGNGVGVETGVVVLLNNEDPDGEGPLTGSDVYAVRTIFGGNNIDDMRNAVPDIRLLVGQVKTVYGGCNNGVMGAKKNDFNDVLGKPLKDVSTHVVVESVNARVIDTIFGGCRMSDVDGNTFVEVKNTHADGVKYIFGGNDISGTVKGYTRIDISGGTVENLFGGSDGRYDYVEVGDSLFRIYPYGTYPNDTLVYDMETGLSHSNYITTASRPDVDSANVNLWGGTVGIADGGSYNGIYGGGAMADCKATHVMVNDTAGGTTTRKLYLAGTLFGGGMGDWEDLNNRDLQGGRYGDVNGSTHVDLYHAESVASGKAYGGGRGGDVENTYITLHEGWNQGLDALYGGCWGSDVDGTAHVIVNGTGQTSGWNVKDLFGGNDFAGDVYKADITVNSGRYNNIYGAGNGDYATSAYTAAPYDATGKNLHVPNAEYVNLTFNNGTVDSNLYGGGKLGTVFTYKKTAMREYERDSYGNKIPDISLSYTESHSDPKDYSYVITNIHSGTFKRNIFAGARGSKSISTPLVYGLKVLNMEGGSVGEAIYGGSHSVNDGYPAECVDKTHSTQRPSSIINLTGGEVTASVYGAGYLGLTYGSTFVNIGIKAIDSCKAYSMPFQYNTGSKALVGSGDSAYAIFKPGRTGSLSPELGTNNLLLDLSVYAGSNWGDNTGSSDFSANGFYGGQSRIIIDGAQYNTANDPLSSLPEMNIHRSILGSGTSVAGGDVYSRIDLRNYGAMVDCHPTKKLEAVQRADGFHLHNTAVEYTGTSSAMSAYISTQYTVALMDSMTFRGYNVAEYDAPVGEIKNIFFYEDAYVQNNLVKTTRPELNANVPTDDGSCKNSTDICDKVNDVVSPTDKKYTLLVLNNGIDFTVGTTSGASLNYANPGVTGFAYATTPYGYNSVITASAKTFNDQVYDKGGFVSPCQQENKLQTATTGYVAEWQDYSQVTDANKENVEFPYTNYLATYRVWEVGEGTRLREAALRAHANPTQLPDEDMSILVNDAGNVQQDLGIATATFILPAADGGHYYMLDPSGFVLSGNNTALSLVDSAWYINPGNAWNDVRARYSSSAAADDYGTWGEIGTSAFDYKEGVSEIRKAPAATFGLIMVPDDKFAQTIESTTTVTHHDAENKTDNYLEYFDEDDNYGANEYIGYNFSSNPITLNDGLEERTFTLTDGSGTYHEGDVTNFRIKVCSPSYDDYDEEWSLTNTKIYVQNGTSMEEVTSSDPRYSTLNSELSDCGDYAYTVPAHDETETVTTGYSYTMPAQDKMPSGWDGTYSSLKPNLVISGNARVNNAYPYCSPVVEEGTRLSPKMRLYLTYDKTFSSTFTGTVEFKLIEYDQNGQRVGPVDVKVYVQTIMEDFKDVTENVLAMYNGGRTNTFTRKVILPALLERRELYLTSVKWVPTNGDGDEFKGSDVDLTEKFWLMDNADSVTAIVAPNWYPHAYTGNEERHNHHNRFALNIFPTNNVTDDLATSAGWERIDMPDINVYTLGFSSGHDRKKYIGWEAGAATTKSLVTEENPRGQQIGVLDGHGSVSLNAQLTFDGTRRYPDPMEHTKGYVGKVVLGLKSYDDEGNAQSSFNLTLYVKTRLNGDTIYIASADAVVRNNCLVQPYDKNSYYQYLLECDGCDDDEREHNRQEAAHMVGHSPNAYVQSFRHALKSNVYEEGDVLCILDTVKMSTDIPVVIQGTTGPAIEVIRYDGHHHEFPDEGCVYRGPMIEVKGAGASLTARNIAFHGGAGATVKHVKTDEGGNIVYVKKKNSDVDSTVTYKGVAYKVPSCAGNSRVPDTNAAFAPIIQVSDGGLVILNNGSTVRHNWNAYGSRVGDAGADGWPTDTKDMGAISVTNGGILRLYNDVTVEQNLMHTMEFDRSGSDPAHPRALYDPLHPGNGAIYVDGGKVELAESVEGTSVTILNNLLVDTLIHDPSSTVKWWTEVTNEGETRWVFDETKVTGWTKANVLLTRTEKAVPSSITNPDAIAYYKDLNDEKSDVFSLTGSVSADTRIGVSKWFPGLTTRDTIQIAKAVGNMTLLRTATNNGNFVPDDSDNRVFYNAKVNNNAAYFFRCATFKHQIATGFLPLAKPDGTGYYPAEDVLYYGPLYSNTCPTGGDTILYRVQGGLMPYTFTWTGAGTDHVHTKPYANSLVQSQLEEGDESYYWASIVDTFITYNVTTERRTQMITANVSVTAVDATGECELSKDIRVRAHLVDTDDSIPVVDGKLALWKPVTSPNGWTDTNSATVAARKTAVGDRYFRGVKITPLVSADPSAGLIAANFNDGDFRVYQYNSNTDSVALRGRLFCEGDKITLKTFARSSTGQHFLMWSFNPYTTNPATYVVPGYDDDVIAYYGPTTYWKDQVNTTTIGGAALSSEYNYSTRPSVASYTVLDGAETPTTTTAAGYVTTYHGDVHIYNENGLAWFISVVNGLNGTQARPMRFNKVFIHKKDAAGTPYDMKMFRWTPVGTLQYGFRGDFIGVSEAVADTVALTADYVTIKGFIVDEPDMDNVGVFSFLDGARVKGINLQNVFVRGGQYASALAATSKNSHISKVAVDKLTNGEGGGAQTSIITTHYTSGTIFGQSVKDTIDNVSVDNIKFAVDALYIGGLAGQAKSSYATNSNINIAFGANVSAFGGAVGQATGSNPEGLFAFLRKSNGQGYIANNYIHIRNAGLAQNIGGVVGHAENTVLENNYVYGLMQGSNNDGGVAATMGQNSKANKNYYPLGDAKNAVGDVSGNASLSDISSFSGSGNKVTLEEPVYGVNNLTRVLNKWVREQNAQGGNFKTWRSDLDDENNGYPVFGVPDMIPVNAHETIDGCEVVVLGGVTYTRDTVITTRVIDNDEMIDSTLTATIRLHYGTQTALFDSALLADGYDGYGFSISPSELELLNLTLDSAGHVSLVFSDTLTTVYGCDSIVTLTLTFTGDPDQPIVETVTTVKVYPNPTTSVVNVETDEMSHVEVYDNEGRKLQDYDAAGRKKVVVDMTSFVTGIYFVRVHTPNEVIIQKVIKQR